MSVSEFVAGVDRLLSRAHDLYPAGGEGEPLPTSGGGSVPASPGGVGGLRAGVTRAAGSYQQARTGAAGLDQELQQAAEQGGAIGAQGRLGSGVIRDQARAVAAAAGPLAKSPAGAHLIMATMDRHLAAMQGQLQATTTQNQALATQLRQLASGYQTLSHGAKDSPPAVPLDSTTGEPGDKPGQEIDHHSGNPTDPLQPTDLAGLLGAPPGAGLSPALQQMLLGGNPASLSGQGVVDNLQRFMQSLPENDPSTAWLRGQVAELKAHVNEIDYARTHCGTDDWIDRTSQFATGVIVTTIGGLTAETGAGLVAAGAGGVNTVLAGRSLLQCLTGSK